jgi:hypothetical protein
MFVQPDSYLDKVGNELCSEHSNFLISLPAEKLAGHVQPKNSSDMSNESPTFLVLHLM